MNSEPDELLDEYRRISAAEAGAPGKTTRDAILAEARKAALRRQPAANDSRYLLRAVAGVAVIGVAVLLWRQQDPRMPTPASTQYPVATKAEAPAADNSASVAAPEPERESPASPPGLLPAPPATRVAEARELADPVEPESRAESLAAATAERAIDAPLPAGPATRSAAAGQAAVNTQVLPADGNTLLRRAFAPPQQNAITPPASAWVIRDVDGVVLRSGIATSPADLSLIATSAQRDFPQRQIGPWALLPATTAAGTPIDVHVAELK